MTTTMSAGYAIPLLILLCALTITRTVYVRSTVLNRRLNMMLASWSVVAILRDPHVQSIIGPLLPDELLIRPITHLVAMLGSAAMWGVADELRHGENDNSRRQRAVYILVAAMGLALFPLSAPSRAVGQTLEQHAGWIDVAYMTVYTAPTIAAVIYIGIAAIGTLRNDNEWTTRVGMIAILGAVTSQLVDAVTRPLCAAVLATGHTNAFTEWRANSNDAMFLPAATLVALVLSWPVLVKVLEKAQWDPASLRLTRIHPMWETLTDAMPTVRFTEPTQTIQDRVDHAEIEVWDAMLRLRPYFAMPEPGDYEIGRRVRKKRRTAVLVCIGLQQACESVAAGEGPLPQDQARAAAKVIDQTDIRDLVKVWNVSLDVRLSGPGRLDKAVDEVS